MYTALSQHIIFPTFVTMGISFEDTNLPVVETVPDERSDNDVDIEEEAVSNAGSKVSMLEYGGSMVELPPWCLFGPKEYWCIFELSQNKSVSFYRVCGNAFGTCKHPGHATGERAKVGYYEPIKARTFIDRRFNTCLSMEEYEYAGKERERMEAKVKEKSERNECRL
jgi:hypothetical protein